MHSFTCARFRIKYIDLMDESDQIPYLLALILTVLYFAFFPLRLPGTELVFSTAPSSFLHTFK